MKWFYNIIFVTLCVVTIIYIITISKVDKWFEISNKEKK